MPKLWIIHRSPETRIAYARLCGLSDTEQLVAAPSECDLGHASAPAAIVLGLDGDFELELDFAHRHRAQLAKTRWLLICAREDVDEARRLFRATHPEILEVPPTARALRHFVSAAITHRAAASLADRQHRQRISERFSAWLGGSEVPGLLRALDPSLANLPLLVRGVPGSGRTLLCRYVEIFRNAELATGIADADSSVLRLQGRELTAPDELARRLSNPGGSAVTIGRTPIQTLWIDEVDAMPVSAQLRLAEIITLGFASPEFATTPLRWIATAGAGGFQDRLDPRLENAFAPLLISVPELADQPDAISRFAEEVARDWTRVVGGVPRAFSDSALTMLEGHPWAGDRAELEAVLRTSLATSSRATIEDIDLRFPCDLLPADIASANEDTAFARDHERQSIDAIQTLIEVEAEEEFAQPSDQLEEAVFDETTAGSPPLDPALVLNLDPDQSTILSEASFDLATNAFPAAPLAPLTPAAAAPAAAPTPAAAATPQPAVLENLSWQRLARSLSHEIRNPLVSIRTFAELLPEHFEDETFRTRFTELVGRDVTHISNVLSRLSSLAEREKPEPEPVDVSSLIEVLLNERRERIANGRLLVLRELERDAPLAWGDALGLQVALTGLLDRALESLPERGDLFVATRHIERGADGLPRLRILMRHRNSAQSGRSDPALAEFEPNANVLEYVLAETVIVSCGGSLTIDSTDAQETLILVDLPTPT